MSRVWEETWGHAHYESGGIWTTELHVGDGQHTCIPFADSRMGDGAEEAEARAKLAAAAPDMARVLLAIEYIEYEHCSICPVCGRTAELHGHADDCALDAALRRAGVR